MSRRYRDRDSGRHWDRPRDRDEEMDRYRGKERHRDRDQERNKDRDHLSRDCHVERNSRDGRDRGRVDHYDRHVGSRDQELREDNEREKNKPRGHRSRPYSKDHSLGKSRSRSRSNSPSRSRSRSHSPSKGKRASGFDMAPVGADVLAASTVPGVLPDIAQPVPGLFPNLFPFGTSQFGGLPLVPPQAMTQQATRHARRVYVGGLPPLANEQAIATYFSRVMAAIGGSTAGPGDSVVNVYINHEKKFAFVEMRTVEEASNAMALDGINFEGVAVRVRRPTDYNPSLAAQLGPSQPSLHLNLAAVGLIPGATCGAEGPDRIFIGGLPYYFTESQIRELLESFGPLRGFDLVKDRDTGNSKGYGFCVYQDAAVTDIACAALNGLKMGDKTLTVRRATVSTGQTRPDQDIILQQAQQHIALQKLVLQAGGAALPAIGAIPMNFPAETPTKVVCLSQALSSDELHDDNEYNEILEDMREEGGKFGELVNVVIPRPSPSGDHSGGVGKVFLEYADTVASAKAKAALNGRKFLDNMVIASFCEEDKFYNGELE